MPLVVLVGLHKLSPLFPHDPNVTFNDFKSPGGVVEYDALAETLSAPRADDDAAAESTCGSVVMPRIQSCTSCCGEGCSSPHVVWMTRMHSKCMLAVMCTDQSIPASKI